MANTINECEAAISQRINRQMILGDCDPSELTAERIEALYDEALAKALEMRRALFPPASSEDLAQRPTR